MVGPAIRHITHLPVSAQPSRSEYGLAVNERRPAQLPGSDFRIERTEPCNIAAGFTRGLLPDDAARRGLSISDRCLRLATERRRDPSAAQGEHMRFLSMIRVDENTGQVPSEQLMQDMGKLIEEMTRDGVSGPHRWPAADGRRRQGAAAKRPAVGGRWTIHGDQGSDRGLCDPRSWVDAGGGRANQTLSEGPRRYVGHRVRSPSAGGTGLRHRDLRRVTQIDWQFILIDVRPSRCEPLPLLQRRHCPSEAHCARRENGPRSYCRFARYRGELRMRLGDGCQAH